MFGALKRMLGIRAATNHSGKSTKTPLFCGSAYFSSRVPKACIKRWVDHGGEVSSGTTLDVRARYFFASDPSEPWVTKLFAKSVVVIHAGWIVHCVDDAFQVPIAQYILDDRFVPGPPYRLTNIGPPTYVPLSEPGDCTDTDTESGGSGPTPVRTSDMPSTPTCMRRKRKRDLAYFDSPSGSFVSSGFDKEGLPRRPRKQRRLRFDPSFSPEGGRSQARREATGGTSLDWLRDHRNTSLDEDDEFSEEHAQDTRASILRDQTRMTATQSPDTAHKPLACEGPSAAHRQLSLGERLSKPTRVSLPAVSVDMQEKIPPVRTIDFTKLPPPARRWRFPQADATISGDTDMTLSVVKLDHKVKTPKKISFANQAQVCVYMVSPQRIDANGDAGAGSARRRLDGGFEDELDAIGKTRMSINEAEDSDDSTAKAIKDMAPQTDSLEIDSDSGRLLGGDQFENDTLTLTVKQVQAMRRRLLGSAAQNDVDDGQLATLFELGKTFQGQTFRHVW